MILMSLKPYYYYLVAERKKKVEIRKGIPRSKVWDRDIAFYMSKDEKSFARIPDRYKKRYQKHFGKVGLMATCNRIYRVRHGCGCYYVDFYLKGSGESNAALTNQIAKQSCLDFDDMWAYLGKRPGYAWVLTKPTKIEPRELKEFHLHGKKPLTKPPQSLCYVEI